MSHRAALVVAAGVVALAMTVVSAQGPAPDPQGAGRGGLRGRGPLGDPSQLPGPGGRGGPIGGPLRDNVQAPHGTAKISGRVVAAETGHPIRRAQIRVNSPEGRTNRMAITDADGRYEISALPAARYRLQVLKAGYVTLEYGQARPFEAGKLLDLAEGQSLEKIDFSLPRGSVIAGRITDEFGEPIADAQVHAMRYQFANGQRQLVNVGRTATTDDIGQFRLFGLMPGEYIIRASVRDTGMMATAIASTEQPSGYPLTYYPSTTDIAQAQPVTVGLAQEMNSVTFALVPSRLARVTGTVLSSQGTPLGGAVVVVRPTSAGGAGGLFNVGGGNVVRADGTFTLNNVPPGDYMLDVQQRPRDVRNVANAQPEFASVPLNVSGSDISGLTILTTPGVTVSGRVVFQGQNAQKVSARGMQITAAAPSGMQSIMGIAGRPLSGGRVNNDEGTFELRGLIGPQMIRVAGVPTGWAVESILLQGEDVTDSPFDFKGGSNMTGMMITLTNRLTDLSGSVKDSGDQPVKDYVLVIFPEDTKLWGAQSRYVRAVRPNQEGAFSIKGLPPARYLAVALESLETGAQNDSALLEQLRPRAERFTLSEGQTLTATFEMLVRQ